MLGEMPREMGLPTAASSEPWRKTCLPTLWVSRSDTTWSSSIRRGRDCIRRRNGEFLILDLGAFYTFRAMQTRLQKISVISSMAAMRSWWPSPSIYSRTRLTARSSSLSDEPKTGTLILPISFVKLTILKNLAIASGINKFGHFGHLVSSLKEVSCG